MIRCNFFIEYFFLLTIWLSTSCIKAMKKSDVNTVTIELNNYEFAKIW
jgi:hypothetical protein